jgi:hypothetical protein
VEHDSLSTTIVIYSAVLAVNAFLYALITWLALPIFSGVSHLVRSFTDKRRGIQSDKDLTRRALIVMIAVLLSIAMRFSCALVKPFHLWLVLCFPLLLASSGVAYLPSHLSLLSRLIIALSANAIFYVTVARISMWIFSSGCKLLRLLTAGYLKRRAMA